MSDLDVTDDTVKYQICICHNKEQPHMFHISEAVGKYIPDKRCPECGADFHMYWIPDYMDKYLYTNEDPRLYSYSNKRQ